MSFSILFSLALFLSILRFQMPLSSWHSPNLNRHSSPPFNGSPSHPLLPPNAFRINDNDIHNNKQLPAGCTAGTWSASPQSDRRWFAEAMRPASLVPEWLSHKEAGGRVWVVPNKAPTRITVLPVLLTKKCLLQSSALRLMRFVRLMCSVPITIWFPKKTLKLVCGGEKLMNPI